MQEEHRALACLQPEKVPIAEHQSVARKTVATQMSVAAQSRKRKVSP